MSQSVRLRPASMSSIACLAERRSGVAHPARRRAGIGKSTLLLQAASHFAREVGPVLYASAEESEHQVKSRGDRLGVGDSPLYLLSKPVSSASSKKSRGCRRRLSSSIRCRPSGPKFQSAPGSIGQVREAATQFLFAAKNQNIPTVLVGHVTKDGSLAGPKVLEHVVDTVLYFEASAITRIASCAR